MATAFKGKEDYFFLDHDSNGWMSLVKGERCVDESLSPRWRALIDSRRESFTKKGIKYFFFVAKSKESALFHLLPESVKGEKSPLKAIKNVISEELVDNYIEPLCETDSSKFYYKGDTHWNEEGGFQAYNELCQALIYKGVTLNLVSQTDFVWKERDFTGDLSSKIDNEQFSSKFSSFPKKNFDLSYNNNIVNTGNVIIFENNTLQGDTVLIYRDSFLSSMIPFLARTFKKLILVWQAEVDYDFVSYFNPDVVINQQTERFLVSCPVDHQYNNIIEKIYKKTGMLEFPYIGHSKSFDDFKSEYIKFKGQTNLIGALSTLVKAMNTCKPRFQISFLSYNIIELLIEFKVVVSFGFVKSFLDKVTVDEQIIRARLKLLPFLQGKEKQLIKTELVNLIPNISPQNIYWAFKALGSSSYRDEDIDTSRNLQSYRTIKISDDKKLKYPNFPQRNTGSIPARYKMILNSGDYVPSLSVFSLKKVFLLSYGGNFYFFDKNRKFIPEISNNINEFVKPLLDIKNRAIDVKCTKSACLIADNYGGHTFGHWVMDWLSRIAIYEHADVEVGVLVGRRFNANFHLQSLEFLGFGDKEQIELGNNTLYFFDDIYVSSNCLEDKMCHVLHGGANFILEWWLDKTKYVPTNGYERIFIPRTTTRKMQNVDEISKILARYNFKLIEPSEHSFKDQVSIFKSAKYIIADHGAALANLIFTREANILEIFTLGCGTEAYAKLADYNANKYESYCHGQNRKRNNYAGSYLCKDFLNSWLKRTLPK